MDDTAIDLMQPSKCSPDEQRKREKALELENIFSRWVNSAQRAEKKVQVIMSLMISSEMPNTKESFQHTGDSQKVNLTNEIVFVAIHLSKIINLLV